MLGSYFAHWRNSCSRMISLTEWVNYIVKMKSVLGGGKENGGGRGESGNNALSECGELLMVSTPSVCLPCNSSLTVCFPQWTTLQTISLPRTAWILFSFSYISAIYETNIVIYISSFDLDMEVSTLTIFQFFVCPHFLVWYSRCIVSESENVFIYLKVSFTIKLRCPHTHIFSTLISALSAWGLYGHTRLPTKHLHDQPANILLHCKSTWAEIKPSCFLLLFNV